MPLDHYVSQVHLRKFVRTDLPGTLLRATSKGDLRQFDVSPIAVCKVRDGNTTEFLEDPRAVERFLRDVEPNYDASLQKLRADQIDRETVFTVAGFTSFVDCCAPAGIRLHSRPIERLLETTAKVLDRQGKFGAAPAELGNKTMSKLIADGTVKFDVNRKYPQAVGISTILDRLSTFGNSQWEILENDNADAPFLTSDYPIVIEYPAADPNFSRTTPLATDLAVRIIPDRSLARMPQDLAFPYFRVDRRRVSREEVMELNRQIARCGETLVFSSTAADWVTGLVEANRYFRIDAVTNTLPLNGGLGTVASMRVVEHRPAPTGG